MSRRRWPREAPVFWFKHCYRGPGHAASCHMVGVEVYPGQHFALRTVYADGTFGLVRADEITPLTPAAREMLAIARGALVSGNGRIRVDMRAGFASFSFADEAAAWELYRREGLRIRLTEDLNDEGGIVLAGAPLEVDLGPRREREVA